MSHPSQPTRRHRPPSRRHQLAGPRHPGADRAPRGGVVRRRPAGARPVRPRRPAGGVHRGPGRGLGCPRSAVLHHRGRPAPAPPGGRAAHRARPGHRRRRSAHHQRLPAGAHAGARRSSWSPATACSSRSRPTWRRCSASPWPAREAIPVPCDDDGLDPDALEALIAEHRPTLLYTVPTFHNPTGRTLSLERRVALAEVAERTGAVDRGGRPLRRAALQRRGAARGGVAAGGSRADAGDLHAVQDRRPRACASAGCGRRGCCCAR